MEDLQPFALARRMKPVGRSRDFENPISVEKCFLSVVRAGPELPGNSVWKLRLTFQSKIGVLPQLHEMRWYFKACLARKLD